MLYNDEGLYSKYVGDEEGNLDSRSSQGPGPGFCNATCDVRATATTNDFKTMRGMCICEMGMWVDDVQESEISSLYVTRAILPSN